MKLTIFGATGPTGRQVLTQALAAGHQVTAVARRPAALDIEHPNLRVSAGDVTGPESSLVDAVTGVDAVISALGNHGNRVPCTVYSAGTAAIVDAMREAGVLRLITISAAPAAPDELKTPLERMVIHRLLHMFFGKGYDDMRRMEHMLSGSDCDWTVFRPPYLTDGPSTGTYRTALDALLPRTRKISRADLAGAMLTAITAPELVRHAVAISY